MANRPLTDPTLLNLLAAWHFAKQALEQAKAAEQQAREALIASVHPEVNDGTSATFDLNGGYKLRIKSSKRTTFRDDVDVEAVLAANPELRKAVTVKYTPTISKRNLLGAQTASLFDTLVETTIGAPSVEIAGGLNDN